MALELLQLLTPPADRNGPRAVAADTTAPAATATAINAQAVTDTGAAAGTTAAGTSIRSLKPDFGKCTNPTMKFGGDFDGRAATESTFPPTNSDGLFGGQQSALNLNIITNFICGNFVKRCAAGQDALNACAKAKATVAALTVRDATVAQTFNSALGF